VAAIIVGKRRGHGVEPMPPHNLTMTLLGTSILWFGWFGFNGGSAVASGATATSAFVVTHIASCAATIAWVAAEWMQRGKPTVLGAATGAVAGLATITPASGFVSPLAALFIGLIAGLICFRAVNFKNKFGYDDSLDVVGVHGVGGIIGTLAVGLFASTDVNPAGQNGLFFGNPSLFNIQLEAVCATIIYVFLMTYIILKVVDATAGLRVDAESEFIGLDHSLHGESGYMS
jgi:Amt family ammonium transporter